MHSLGLFIASILLLYVNPPPYTQCQEVGIITLFLQKGKLRYGDLSYVPKIAKLLCGKKHSSAWRDSKMKNTEEGGWDVVSFENIL